MRVEVKLSICTILVAGLLFGGGQASAKTSTCKLADKVATEAAKQVKKDKTKGLKLFIKAQSLCPDSAEHNFNLALAYYRHGDGRSAQKYGQRALSFDKNNTKLKNALAWVMLENGTNLSQARKYAQECVKKVPGNPAYMDTLIRAYQKSGMKLDALQTAQKALKKWPSNAKLKKRYQQVEDTYLAHYLALGKQGKTKEALGGLATMSDSPKAAEGRCWLLHKSGKTVEALKLAKASASKFGSEYPPLKQAFSGIMDGYIQAQYAEFQSGRPAEAVTAIDEMKTRFPNNTELNAAYKKMFNAILADVKTIQVPKPKSTAVAASGSGQSDGLLDGLRNNSGGQSEVSLVADVDKNIPKGRDKRPHAVAVVIGNKRYSQHGNAIPDVKYADRDAAFIRKYLVETFGYDSANVIYEQDATQGDLLKIFGSKFNPRGKLHNYVKPGKSEVFIFYSGHGAPDLDKGRAFMVPVDADVSYIANNGYGMDVFYDNLAKLPAKSVTVVMDACFSGNSANGMLVKNVSPALLKTSSPVRKMKNTVVFSSTGKGQVSHWFPEKGHGLFTYFFLKGISGDADANKNKRVTVAEMKSYLKGKVPYQARRMGNSQQTPVIVSGLGDEMEIVRLK